MSTCVEGVKKFNRIGVKVGRGKIRPYNRQYKTKINNVQSIDWTQQSTINRAGAIPYTVRDGEIYVCLGIDKEYGNYTDFGGGVKKSDGTPVKSALRELREESLNIFGNIHPEDIGDHIAVWNKQILVIFIYMDVDMDEIVATFNDRVSTISDPEVSKLVWVTKDEFLDSIKQNGDINMYHRVGNLFKGSINFVECL
jgi:hypothetical protein